MKILKRLLLYWFKCLKKAVRRKDFWFAVIVYPLIAVGFMWCRSNPFLKDIVDKTGIWYFILSFFLSGFIIFNFIWHVIKRKLKHTGQGDKLKIKKDSWR